MTNLSLPPICIGTATPSRNRKVTASSSENNRIRPIGVASIHDLSEGLDIYGKPMVDALMLAVEEANAAGGLLGRQVKLINYDTQSNMQLYTQFAQQAALKDKVAVVHGGITVQTDGIEQVSADSPRFIEHLSEQWIERTNRYTSQEVKHWEARRGVDGDAAFLVRCGELQSPYDDLETRLGIRIGMHG